VRIVLVNAVGRIGGRARFLMRNTRVLIHRPTCLAQISIGFSTFTTSFSTLKQLVLARKAASAI